MAGETPLLSFSSNNGSVAPQYRVVHSCDIFRDHLVQDTTGRSVRSVPVIKQISWTTDVPNAQTAIELLEKASLGKVKRFPAPIGGGVDSFEGILQGREHYTLVTLLLSGGQNARNTSKAAKTLVKFINYNCL